MTRFEEIMAAVNKNKKKKKQHSESNILEVDGFDTGGGSSKHNPLLSCSDDTEDPSLIDQLYRNWKHKPLEGWGADAWD